MYVNGNDGNECVVITGRPYRVKSMRAVPATTPATTDEPRVKVSNDVLSPQ